MGRAGVSTWGCLTPQLGTPPTVQVPLQTESRPQTAGAIGRLPGGPCSLPATSSPWEMLGLPPWAGP